jgi:hypothetical protein
VRVNENQWSVAVIYTETSEEGEVLCELLRHKHSTTTEDSTDQKYNKPALASTLTRISVGCDEDLCEISDIYAALAKVYYQYYEYCVSSEAPRRDTATESIFSSLLPPFFSAQENELELLNSAIKFYTKAEHSCIAEGENYDGRTRRKVKVKQAERYALKAYELEDLYAKKMLLRT